MLISNILNDSIGLLSKQLRFYCWHFRKNLDHKQCLELIELLYEQHFERLANKIRLLNQSSITDCRQQIAKLLFEQCLRRDRRHQLIQLIESDLVDIDVRLDNYGRTLLHRSAYGLDVELVKILINHGVNIKLRDYAGNTALHIAVQSYRNGAIIYTNGREVAGNLIAIIKLLLDADKSLQKARYQRKRSRLLLPIDDNNNAPAAKRSYSESQIMSQSEADKLIESHNQDQSLDSNYYEGPTPLSTESSNATPADTNKAAHPSTQSSNTPITHKQDFQPGCQADRTSASMSLCLNPILLEDENTSLIDTKNAFGRTALHYCVLVVGEQYVDEIVQLLIAYGADTDAIDMRMQTPLYCLVKRPSVSSQRQKHLAIMNLIKAGCDDLGLALRPGNLNEDYFNQLERNSDLILQIKTHNRTNEPIFTSQSFKRVPSLKHLVRLNMIRLNDRKSNLKRQSRFTLPQLAPASLNDYINRKILDQSELY